LNLFELAGLPSLMRLTRGRSDLVIGIIDGGVNTALPAFAQARIQPAVDRAVCSHAAEATCVRATMVTSLLAANDDSPQPGICPGCTFALFPIFVGAQVRASPLALADAIHAVLNAGARIINLSAALEPGPAPDLRALRTALDEAMRHEAIVVAAAGNQARIGASPVLSHAAVLPVAACGLGGRPTPDTNLGRTIAQRGISAPGERVPGLKPDGQMALFGGTSAAVPFVTGTLALLRSLIPRSDRQALIWALRGEAHRRTSLMPPRLDAWAAYKRLVDIREEHAA
jgi:subtilisin family serine protease